MISINGKKKEKKEKRRRRRSNSRQRRRDRWLCWQSAGCCFNWAQILFRCVLLLNFFFFFFEELFFFFSGSFFFFFLTSPFVQDMKLSDLLPIFILLRAFSFLLDLIITSYQCIGQNSQESWNKKKPFEPQKLVTVHKTGRSDRGPCGSLLFWYGIVLLPKQTVKQNGSRFFRLDHTVRFGFQNL